MPMTEYEKMLSGALYDASDSVLAEMRRCARMLMHQYNHSPEDKPLRYNLLQQLLHATGKNIDIQPPFYCDYGSHISVGENFFANFNCVLLDCAQITIGDNVFLAPNVQLYAAHHPVMAAERIKGPELASPISIGNNVWIGGGTIVCPGVSIGDNTTIGAGSVVVRSIPANSLAVGNPCKVIRQLD